MRRSLPIAVLTLVFAMVAALIWVSNSLPAVKPQLRQKTEKPNPGPSLVNPVVPAAPTASESLLVGYGDPSSPPIEDLRKIQRVAIGYFSLIKDASRFPIGGNEDFSAALKGANANREVFIRPENPVFSNEGLLVDRWGTPVIVHPEEWKQLELRSAGPDRIPHNADDVVLSPAGNSGESK